MKDQSPTPSWLLHEQPSGTLGETGHESGPVNHLSEEAGLLLDHLIREGELTLDRASELLSSSSEEVEQKISELESFSQLLWDSDGKRFKAGDGEAHEPFPRMFGRITRSFLIFLAMKVPSIGVGFFTKVMIGHWLGAAMFGLYSVVMNAAVAMSFVLPLGFPTALSRLLPLFLREKSYGKVRGVIQVSLLTTVASWGVMILVAGPLISWIGRDAHVHTAYFAGILLAGLMSVSSVLSSCFRAHKNWVWSLLAGLAVPAIYLSVAAAVFVLFGAEPGDAPSLLLFTMGAIMVVSILTQIVGMRRAFPASLWKVPAERRWKSWIARAAPMLVVSGMVVILLRMDLFVIAGFKGHREAGIYSAALAIVTLLSQVLRAANSVVMPEIAPLYVARRMRTLQQLANVQAIISFWPLLIATIGVIVFGKELLHLWHPDFVAAYPALVILAISMVIRASNGDPGYFLLMCGKTSRLVRVYLVIALLDLAVLFVLVPAFGLIGGAVSTLLALCGSRIYLRRVVHRELGIDTGILTLFNAARHREATPNP